MEPKCERTQYGYTRTTCGCWECSIWCSHMPGYMVPDDVLRMYAATKLENEPIPEWAMRTLLASPGAKVCVRADTPDEKIALHVISVPTLVPARKTDDSCIHLTAEGKCGIHAVSPFGCAFVDSHMTKKVADEISTQGLRDLMLQLDDPHVSLYYQIWQMLADANKRAPSAKEARERVAAEYKKEPTDDRQPQ